MLTTFFIITNYQILVSQPSPYNAFKWNEYVDQLSGNVCYGIYSVALRPPGFFMIPQLQIMCFYITRYYVKNARTPGGDKTYIFPELGGGQNRSVLWPPGARIIFT